jgi:hypothetical protein
MNDIISRIAVKQKQIQVETDPSKKSEYEKQLLVLNIRKKIRDLQKNIDQINN